MKKDIFKRILSVIMAVILCTGMLGGFSAFAAGEQVENYQLAFPRRGDVNYSDKWGHGKLKHMNGWFSDEAKYNTVFTIGSYSGPACYCIEPGTPIENKYKLTSRDESYWDNFPSEYNHTITVPDIKIFIGRIMQYGYTGNVSINWRTQNEADADSFSLYYATQLLIWETVVGERDSDFNHIMPVGCNAILDKIGAEHPMKSRIMSHYNNIVEGVKTHMTTPSFCSKTPSGGETKELKWDGSQYTATFTDTNNILQRFSFSADNLAPGEYTVTEETPEEYAEREAQHITVTSGQTATVSFNNTLKKFKLTVIKADAEQGAAQGNAALAGAEYGIYKGNQLMDTYTTDADGSFTTKYYVCGNDWSLKELTAGEGYLVTNGSEHIGAEPKNYTAEYNGISLNVKETVKKGRITIIKHTDDGGTKIETPEKGAEFEVFLKSAGSYANAKETERDTLVCDKNGFAETKALPYGEYTVKQTKGQSGREHIAPFNVFISKDGETYRFLINNAVFKSAVEIVKKDAETGKIIPAAGIGFKVRNTDTGKFVVQHITYPTPADIDTYYTDITGKLMLPEKLPYGNYEITEQCTAYGYVLNTEPVAFKIDGSKTVVTVEKRNMPQKGIIRLQKNGEVFESVNKSDGVYQPVFANKGLACAVYEITAAEDIITPDGTLRYAKGTAVDTVTTDKKGNAESRPLYLGKYTVREIKAPYGIVLNDEAKSVELTYAGETVEVTETAIELYNERQKAMLSLEKLLEKDSAFGIGENGEISSVQFGLYAAEKMTAADGSVIPTDALLETAGCDENGKLTFKTDIPVGARLYVKEIATDGRYILSDEKYPVSFEYAGQKTALVKIKVNGGEAIKNNIIYGSVKGLKIDRETESVIAGAVFGLFRGNETEFTYTNAILTAESDKDGIFTFSNIPYGSWIIKELKPENGYLPNDEIYSVLINNNGQEIEIKVVNNRVPEIRTKAAVNGEKTAAADGEITVEDTVYYSHLIPGREYAVKGILMDKSTGAALLVNGKEITAEITFTPEKAEGEVIVRYTFDGRCINRQTDIVVFEALYCDGEELAVHADIDDTEQTVTLTVPPAPYIPAPKTGDNSKLDFWIGLAAVALGGVISAGIIRIKSRKDDDE